MRRALLLLARALLVFLPVYTLMHELGHFLACLALGVEVKVFTFGFGPEALRLTVRSTQFVFHAVPFTAGVEFGNAMGLGMWKLYAMLLSGPLAGLAPALIIFTARKWKSLKLSYSFFDGFAFCCVMFSLATLLPVYFSDGISLVDITAARLGPIAWKAIGSFSAIINVTLMFIWTYFTRLRKGRE